MSDTPETDDLARGNHVVPTEWEQRFERDETRARVELIKPHKNNPVAEYFSSSNTPETDAAVIASNGQWSFVLKETCQRLERERNKAVEDATNYFARIGELERERDEAMQALSGRTVSCAACNHAAIERDEAREKAERYRLEANAMMLQRDELKKIVEQRILVGAEIHDKANSLLKQSNRTEAECEALRKQLTAATSALRQIHLEVGDWIRSTIIVEE